MKENKEIEKIIFSSIEELNDQLPKKSKLRQSSTTTLFGENGKLDSLGLVNLLIIIEQNIEDEFDISITLADEKAMSLESSPFRTVDTLVNYINSIIN